jgi:hypothetical protein
MRRYDSGTIAWALATAIIMVALFATIYGMQVESQKGYDLRQKYLAEAGLENFHPFASNDGYDFYMVPK